MDQARVYHGVPRLPTSEEREELLQLYIRTKYRYSISLRDIEDERDLVQGAAIAMFDHYTSDSPRYQGKVMIVVWSDGPEFYQLYSWDEGKMKALPTRLQ